MWVQEGFLEEALSVWKAEERAGICQIRSGEKCHRAWSYPEAIDWGREEVKEILGVEVPSGGGL